MSGLKSVGCGRRIEKKIKETWTKVQKNEQSS